MQTLLLVIVVVVVLGQAELVVVMVVEQPIVILCVAVTVVRVGRVCLFLVDGAQQQRLHKQHDLRQSVRC